MMLDLGVLGLETHPAGSAPENSLKLHYPFPMATSTYEICCLIQGGNATFSVIAPYTALIRQVKGLIRERLKDGVLRDVDARYVTLTKVKVRRTTSSV